MRVTFLTNLFENYLFAVKFRKFWAQKYTDNEISNLHTSTTSNYN